MKRFYYPALTRGQITALQEAALERAAGCPEESGGLPAQRYDDAAGALAAAPGAEVALFLTRPQALALQALIGFAHGGMEGEPYMPRYRTPAAERAVWQLDKALR